MWMLPEKNPSVGETFSIRILTSNDANVEEHLNAHKASSSYLIHTITKQPAGNQVQWNIDLTYFHSGTLPLPSLPFLPDAGKILILSHAQFVEVKPEESLSLFQVHRRRTFRSHGLAQLLLFWGDCYYLDLPAGGWFVSSAIENLPRPS
jgi:hypothetical protein